jgi:hypothetical protein
LKKGKFVTIGNKKNQNTSPQQFYELAKEEKRDNVAGDFIPVQFV